MPLDNLEELYQDVQLDYLGPIPALWGANKYILICVDQFIKFSTFRFSARTAIGVIKDFLESYIALRAIPRVIPTGQGLGFNCKSIRDFRTNNNISLLFAPVGKHRATGFVA